MKRAILAQAKSERENDLVFSLNDNKAMKQLVWDGDDEFSLNGEMYDLIQKKTNGDKLIIRALADKKETALLRKAIDNCKENGRSNKIASDLFQLLQSLFYSSGFSESGLIKPLKYRFYFSSEELCYRMKEIPTPPPQAV
jgi:hypothetical protein